MSLIIGAQKILASTASSTSSEITEPTTEQLNAFQRWWSSINWTELTGTVISKILAVLALTILFAILIRLADYFIDRGFRMNKKKKQNEIRVKTIKTLSKNVARYTLGFFYIYSLLSSLGVPVGSLLAGAGIAGLAIGLGAQGFMNDVINGFFIIIEQQFNVGDYILLTDIALDGTVISVGLRTLQLQSFDGTVHFIPNRNITTISNMSRFDMRVLVEVRVKPSEGIEGIQQAIERANQQIVDEYSEYIQTPPAIFGVVDLGNSNFAVRTIMYVTNGQQYQLHEELLSASIQELTKDGYTIPSTPINI
ncbi:mechanosensitive ion channel family protein [Tetragenococcus osmophilus]|uniref:Potassium efflux system protein/small-conductance mechanosensitive channel n=2 Tax=Tetragenococcus TaxID=51668 RepID=A0A091C3Z2_9ENTE|nr:MULTISPECIES: mechanosensitive ion channel family protein [Tetragenococcus]AYW48520.1 mechanosensitive ion channel family protein [Tetragenococcus osmophilus]KFN91649.1 potassium efflux system protein/small-conductance mechanosensitive channel [Tetragenococcus muriaticus PMC-11-5]